MIVKWRSGSRPGSGEAQNLADPRQAGFGCRTPFCRRMSSSDYRDDIDGLRALAVSAVVLHHAFPALAPGGFVGVDVFFVISGYLISAILLHELRSGTFSLSGFYARRIRRIFPALTLVLIGCYAFGWVSLYADEYGKLGRHIAHGAGFVSNFAFWQEGGYFDQAAETKPLNHLWSLGIEEQFYIAWPLILWGAWQIWRKPLALAMAILAGSFVFNLYLAQSDTIADFYSPLSRVWELLVGAALSFAGKPAWQRLIGSARARVILGQAGPVMGFVLILFPIWAFNKIDPYPGWRALLPTLGAALILTGSNAWFNRAVLSCKPARWIGLISYSLYLWHWPLLAFARVVSPKISDLAIVGLVILAIALAYLSYILVEVPVRRWKPLSYRVGLLILPLALTGFAGYNAYARDGLDFREVSLTYYLAKARAFAQQEGTSDAVANRPGYQGNAEPDPTRVAAQDQQLHKLVSLMQSSGIFFKELQADPESGHKVQSRELEGQNCRSTAPTACLHNALRGARIVILGDSHAGNLTGVFAYAYPAIELIPFFDTGCTPISRRYTEENNRCGQLIKRALKYAMENHPDAVIFAARWPLDFELIEKDLADFGQYTRKLILVGPGPEFQPDPSHFLLRFAGGDAVQYINSFLLPDQFDKNQRMKRFAEKARVGFIDRINLYCTPSFCPLTSNGQDLLIYDSNHLTRSGTVYLGDLLSDAKVLERLMAPQNQ